MQISVFGASRPVPGDQEYEDGYQLGRLLALQGHTTITGGYIGLMEAVSKGAAEHGGHVIGITCAEIEQWRPSAHNPWVTQEIRLPTLHERLIRLIDQCDLAIALPGGLGTLAEITMMWNRLVVDAISAKPLILTGPGWKKTFAAFDQECGQFIHPKDWNYLHFAATIQETAELVTSCQNTLNQQKQES